MNKDDQKFMDEISEFIDSLDETMYFNIPIQDAIDLNVLPKLTISLCESFNFDKIYFNKEDASYFQNFKNEKVFEYAFTKLNHEYTKFTWDHDNLELSTRIQFSAIFLWMGAGINLIGKNPDDYTKYKNHLMLNLIQFSSLGNVFSRVLSGIIETLEKERKPILKMLQMDLQVIFDSYTRIESTKKQSKSNKKNETLAYRVALLHEIEFFKLDKIKRLNKTQQRMVVMKLIGGTDRQVKGNINVLNPDSLDDRLRYTSFSFENEVRKFVNNQPI